MAETKTARPRPAAVTLTTSAEARIAKLMSEAPEGAIGVKLSTPRRGCSGLAYSVEYVSEANAFDERIETPRYTLCLGAGKTWNTVQRQRFSADEVDDVLAEARTLLRERGRPSTQWEVGSSASPPGLVDLLLERGLVWDRDPFAVALVLTREPPPTAPKIVARRVETFEEFAAASAVQWVAFESTEAQIEESRALGVIANLLEAHGRAYRVLKAEDRADAIGHGRRGQTLSSPMTRERAAQESVRAASGRSRTCRHPRSMTRQPRRSRRGCARRSSTT